MDKRTILKWAEENEELFNIPVHFDHNDKFSDDDVIAILSEPNPMDEVYEILVERNLWWDTPEYPREEIQAAFPDDDVDEIIELLEDNEVYMNWIITEESVKPLLYNTQVRLVLEIHDLAYTGDTDDIEETLMEWSATIPNLDWSEARAEMENCPYAADFQIMIGVTLDEAIEISKTDAVHIHEAKAGLVDNMNGSGGLLEVTVKDLLVCTRAENWKYYSPKGTIYIDSELNYGIDKIYGTLSWNAWEASVSPATLEDFGDLIRVEYIGEGGEPILTEIIPYFHCYDRIKNMQEYLEATQPQKITGTIERRVDKEGNVI